MKLIISLTVLFSLFMGIYGVIPTNLTTYAVIAATTITNTGSLTLNGDMAVFPGTAITGFPPGIVSGTQQLNTPAAKIAQTGLIAFYLQLSNLNCTGNLTGQDLGGKTLIPGVYCFAADAAITGTLTLDAQNLVSPIWVFQIATAVTTASLANVRFINGSAPCNVFWNIGSSITLGSSSNLLGVVNAYTSITAGSGATITGKLFAQNGAITFNGNTHTQCTESNDPSRFCSGRASTDPLVCSARGTCVFNETCACNTGYTGSNCQSFSCYSRATTDPLVCGGQGTCTGPNTCNCNSNYGGAQCQFPICYTKLSNDPTVCSSQGTCTAPNNCVCYPQANGTQCQTSTSCQNDVTLAILAGTTITSTGASTVNGDLGLSPGTLVTGFPPGIVTGNQYIASAISLNAQLSLLQKFNQLTALTCGTTLTGQDLGGKTFKSGVYCFDTTAQITGTLTLDGNGDARSYWVFQMGTGLSTSASANVLLINGGLACNVFWKVGSSATIGASATFSGNILALTSVSLGTGATVTGKVLAQNGAVTMIANTITNCPFSCALSCGGKLATDMSVCGGKGTCTFPGYCVCQNGTSGSNCTSSPQNSSSAGSFSVLLFIISLFFGF